MLEHKTEVGWKGSEGMSKGSVGKSVVLLIQTQGTGEKKQRNYGVVVVNDNVDVQCMALEVSGHDMLEGHINEGERAGPITKRQVY